MDIGTYDELLARGHDPRSILAEDEKGDGGVMDKYGTTKAESSDAAVEPPELMKIRMRTSIIGVDGYIADENITDCYYADYENQVTMENCPDSIANQIESKRSTDNDYLLQESSRIGEGYPPSRVQTASVIVPTALMVNGAGLLKTRSVRTPSTLSQSHKKSNQHQPYRLQNQSCPARFLPGCLLRNELWLTSNKQRCATSCG